MLTDFRCVRVPRYWLFVLSLQFSDNKPLFQPLTNYSRVHTMGMRMSIKMRMKMLDYQINKQPASQSAIYQRKWKFCSVHIFQWFVPFLNFDRVIDECMTIQLRRADSIIIVRTWSPKSYLWSQMIQWYWLLLLGICGWYFESIRNCGGYVDWKRTQHNWIHFSSWRINICQ